MVTSTIHSVALANSSRLERGSCRSHHYQSRRFSDFYEKDGLIFTKLVIDLRRDILFDGEGSLKFKPDLWTSSRRVMNLLTNRVSIFEFCSLKLITFIFCSTDWVHWWRPGPRRWQSYILWTEPPPMHITCPSFPPLRHLSQLTPAHLVTLEHPICPRQGRLLIRGRNPSPCCPACDKDRLLLPWCYLKLFG